MTEEYKVCVVGADIGKSALVVRFIHNEFVDQDDPTIEDNYSKTVTIDNQPCKIDILDTSGNVEYASFYEKWFKWADAFVCVYSITLQDSYDYITFFREVIRRIKKVEHVPMVLVGTKADSETKRQVSEAAGRNLAGLFECPFFETSAKRGANVKEAFYEVIREARRLQKKAQQEQAAIANRLRRRPAPAPPRRDVSRGRARSQSKNNARSKSGGRPSTTKDEEPWKRPIKPGYLSRHTGGLSGWTKRFFVLTSAGLYYFKSDKDLKSPSGFISLEGVETCSPTKQNMKKKELILEIPSDKTHLIMCETPVAVRDWVSAIQGVVMKSKSFGVPIDTILARSKRDIPWVVEKCVSHLEANALTLEGVYRISGDTSEVVGLKQDFDEDERNADLSQFRDFHVVAGCLKLFFREMPEPLLTFGLYDKFIAAQKQPDPRVRVKATRSVVEALPRGNAATLKYMCAHLAKVASHNKQNKMTVSNLAIVFGPTLMRAREKEGEGFNPQLLFDMKFQQMTVQCMIDNFEEVFAGVKSSGGSGGGARVTSSHRPKSPARPHHRVKPPSSSGPRGAPRSSSVTLPPNWREYTNSEGRRYYHNKVTGETSWSFPMENLPPGWQAMTSPEGKVYFYNQRTKSAQWDYPS